MFAATGLKAFLMAMAIPLSQSAISSFLLRRKGNRDDWWRIFFKKNYRWRRPFQEEEYPEDATDFATGGRGNGYSSSSSNYYDGRRRRHDYQSWVSKDFAASAASTAVGADGNTKSSSSGDGGGNKSSGRYGGWDELLDNNTTAAAQKAKRSSKHSQLATLLAARNRGLQRLGRKMRIITAAGGGRRVEQGVGAPPERMTMRRRRMPRMMGLGSTRYKQAAAPLMRLLVAVFPFLGSWFRLL
jgi:hypothetical protein